MGWPCPWHRWCPGVSEMWALELPYCFHSEEKAKLLREMMAKIEDKNEVLE